MKVKKQVLISFLLSCSILTVKSQIRVPNDGISPLWYNSNNVGIGTSTPNEIFEIKKNVSPNILLWNNSINNDGTTAAKINFWGSDANYEASNPSAQIKFIRAGSGATGNIAFSTRGNNFLLTEALRILANGNVGIGTLSPTYKLDVIGTIRAKEIKVDLDGADFVFEKDYKLMPLNELEKYVIEQKHLPEIATAEDMKLNGTEIGDLNSKLLQKIEELTLYVIEQNKRIAELEKQNNQVKTLEKKIEEIESAFK